MNNSKKYNNEIHKTGRIFTAIALSAFCAVPIIFCLVTGAVPNWKTIAGSITFILGYWAIALVEVVSYAPLLGSGGHYQAFITGNIANLKLPCAINTQSILKTKQGSEEEDVITTLSIAVSTITTTLIIIVGLIPLSIFSTEIVEVLAPVSPYVIPAIFGGLGVVLLSMYFKLTIIPFGICLALCIVLFAFGIDIGQSTMIPVGMVISLIIAFFVYKKIKKNNNAALEEKENNKKTIDNKE